MIKKTILIIAPLFLFSGCFLMKQAPQNGYNNYSNYATPTTTMNTKMIVTSISNDCYDCDTFTISIRER